MKYKFEEKLVSCQADLEEGLLLSFGPCYDTERDLGKLARTPGQFWCWDD